MKNTKKTFHLLSYLQYPLMLIGLYFVLNPYFNSFQSIWEDSNYTLVFFGLGISMSTLQDTTKSQNNLSTRVWENPKYAKAFLLYLAILTLLVTSIGIYCLFWVKNPNLKSLSFGIIAMGISLIGLLKSAIEMAENHQKKMVI
jgi:hypothetical protein